MTVVREIPRGFKVCADRNLLRIVYENLLSNAVKYGRQGGRIVLDACRRGKDVEISVFNDGEAIPQERADRLFSKFQRFDGGDPSGRRGTGLGLFIVKQIIEQHGGRVWIESAAGDGVTFRFVLPDA
jgi:signal transduction histidine kinase